MMRSLRTLGLSCTFAILAMVFGHLPATAGELKRDIPAATKIIDSDNSSFKDMEPSGLVSGGSSVLYMVSDNGKIVKLTLGSDSKATAETLFNEAKGNDFESLAVVPAKSGFLYIGVEGSGKDKPSIREFNLSNKSFTKNEWKLEGVSDDMEGMTFVPDDKVKDGFKGYFLACSQKSTTVYGYHLPSSNTHKKKTFKADFKVELRDAKTGMSDLYYSPDTSVLYVAYDDENPGKKGDQALWEYERSGKGKDASYGLIAQTTMPSPGFEAITVTSTSQNAGDLPVVGLYAGFDLSSKQPSGKNRIDLYPGYLAYQVCGGKASTCADILHSHCGWCASGKADQPRASYGWSKGPVTGNCKTWIWEAKDCKK
jgi:hypothetical protein